MSVLLVRPPGLRFISSRQLAAQYKPCSSSFETVRTDDREQPHRHDAAGLLQSLQRRRRGVLHLRVWVVLRETSEHPDHTLVFLNALFQIRDRL